MIAYLIAGVSASIAVGALYITTLSIQRWFWWRNEAKEALILAERIMADLQSLRAAASARTAKGNRTRSVRLLQKKAETTARLAAGK